mmetsp:Transcript_1000/g.1559  ORF Transcript_1000/g.1559 Transcript_1000/m.1559 type:complete len:345 (-) Transcript_1000:6-1040(-)
MTSLPTKEEVEAQKELDRNRKREEPPKNQYLILENDRAIKKKKTNPIIYYDPDMPLFKDYKINTIVDVWIDKKHLVDMKSSRKIWGTSVYTEDSDLVLICHHMGFLNLDREFDRLQSISGLKVRVRVLPLPSSFHGSYRHGLRSNDWTVSPAQHCSITVLKCSIARDTLVGTPASDLMLSTDPSLAASSAFSSLSSSSNRNSLYKSFNSLIHRNRVLDGLTIIYNRRNEPCVRFTLDDIKDAGPHPSQFTSYRLQSSSLYIDTSDSTFEVSFLPLSKSFKLSRVLLASSSSSFPSIPLSNPSHVSLIYDDLKWSDFIWSRDLLRVRSFSCVPLSISFVDNKIIN